MKPRRWTPKRGLDSVAASLEVSRKAAADFKPSDLAVNPVNGDLFVLSSSLTSIVVLDSSRRFVAAFRLDKDVLPQPEGIAFMTNGDMFVASEAPKRGVLAFYRRSAGH